MKEKNEVEVLIGGEKYTICGYESADYLQRIATYINKKRDEVAKNFPSSLISSETKAVLTEINIADDYYSASLELENMKMDIEEKDKTIFELKHEMISDKEKLEDALKKIMELEAELNIAKKRIR